MFCFPAALVTGLIGALRDQRNTLAVLVTAISAVGVALELTGFIAALC